MSNAMQRQPATPEEVWAILREVSASQRETDRRMKETDRQMQETDRRMQETDRRMQETDRYMKETDRQLRELKDLFNGQWGKLMDAEGVPGGGAVGLPGQADLWGGGVPEGGRSGGRVRGTAGAVRHQGDRQQREHHEREGLQAAHVRRIVPHCAVRRCLELLPQRGSAPSAARDCLQFVARRLGRCGCAG